MASYLRQSDFLVEISERLNAMRTQEAAHYGVPDYLTAEWQQKLRDAAGPDSADEASPHHAHAAHSLPPSSSISSPPSPANAAVDVHSASSGSGSSQINELWREKICEWCYQVVDHFDFNREVVSVAMSYLDRYLATRTVNRRVFQLAAMTALYLAIKLFEPGRLRMSSLIELSRGYFMAEHIVTMEDSMLQSLRWRVHPPTSFAFCRELVRLFSNELPPRARHDVTELARFMTELSVCDYWFVTKKPSSVALAAIVNAIELQGSRKVDPRFKVEFLHRVVDIGVDIANNEEIIECYERLREMYIAGGYTPGLEEGGENNAGAGGRVAAVSPTGVGEGPDADESGDDDLSQMECA